jgi:glycosyltransferase involved in cell wall biosynthesis
MREEFYAQISCLVHPVAEGKEGASNTIMEALACGVPVITTRHCGFHADHLRDGQEILYAERSASGLAQQIKRLRSDSNLRERLSRNGRRFVERHHDIARVAREYRNVFASVMRGIERLNVSFVPFGTPVERMATARLRCAYMVDSLNEFFGAYCRADLGLTDAADVIVVSQLCPETTLIALQERRAAGKTIVYDCCDPYYDRNEEVYGVHAAQRFRELVDLCESVTVPTEGLRRRLVDAGVTKPVVVVPDGIDYSEQMQPALVEAKPSVVWFGHPGHGNFESGLWALRCLKDRFGHAVTLITKPDKISAPADFTVEAWAFDGFVNRLRAHGLALISQDPTADFKSENRFLVSIANGVPAISVGSASVGRLLDELGYPEMSVATEEELERAMELLSDADFRRQYVLLAQVAINDRFARLPIAKRFFDQVLASALSAQAGAKLPMAAE